MDVFSFTNSSLAWLSFVASQLIAHSSSTFSWRSFGNIEYNTATFILPDTSCPYSVLNLAILSSQVSISTSALAAIIFPGERTAEIAFIPDARVLGFKDEVIFFQASHPCPLHLLTMALASPVVMFSRRLYISFELSMMNCASLLSKVGRHSSNLPFASSSSEQSFSTVFINIATFPLLAATWLRSFVANSSYSL